MSTEPTKRKSKRRKAAGDLRADDFRRLGLELSEARVSVIRKATRQATAQLASSGSKRSSGMGSEAELARMVVSAYRILDPRRRDVVSERIQLLRAQPKPIRTSLLQVGDSVAESEPAMTEGVASGAEASLLDDESGDDQWMMEMLADLRTEPLRHRTEPLRRIWATTHSRRSRKRFLGGRDRMWVGAWLFVVVALIGGIVGVIAWRWFGGGDRHRSVAGAGSNTAATVSPLADEQQRKATQATPPIVDQQDIDGEFVDGELQASDSVGRAVPIPEYPLEPGNSDRLSGLETQADELRESGLAQVPLAIPSETRSADNAALEGVSGAVGIGADRSNPKASGTAPEFVKGLQGISGTVGASQAVPNGNDIKGVATPTEDASRTVPEAAEGPLEAGVVSDALTDMPLGPDAPQLPRVRFPVPEGKAREDARRELENDYPGLMRATSADTELLRAAWNRAEQLLPGSPGQFVLMQEVIQKSILLGFWETSLSLQLELVRHYELELSQLDRLMFADLVDEAATISEQERVATWALMALDRAVISEDYKLGEELLLAGTRLASQMNDDLLRARYRMRREQFAATTRIGPRVQEILSTSSADEVTAEEANLVARYLCLDRREWSEGLPWMVRGRDVRLAALARDELTFGENSDAQTILALAEKWIQLGEEGRRSGGDSMLVHGRELLVRAAEKAEGVERLEIEKRLKEFTANLPEDLKPLVIPADPFSVGFVDNTASTSGRNTAGLGGNGPSVMIPFDSIPDPLSLGVLGRLVVAGQDTGLVFQYPTHIPLRTDSLEPLLKQRGFADGLQQIEFHGTLYVPETTTVHMVIDGIGPTTRVAIDGQPTVLVPSADAVRRAEIRIDLNTGLHRVVWQTSGGPLPTLRLVLRDERTGEFMHLRHDESSRQVVERLPVISRVQIRPQ